MSPASPRAGLDGPSRTIVVEPVETPAVVPVEEPAREPVTVPSEPEKVPA